MGILGGWMSETEIRAMEAVTTFAAVARALTESLELSEVLRRIASEVLGLTHALGVSVVMPRDGEAEFVAHESPPPHSRIPVGFRFVPHPDLVAALRGRREPLVVRDLHDSPLIPVEIKEQITARDLIIVPLRVDGALLGALTVAFDRLPAQRPWDVALLRAVGDQAAVAIRNAQLYESARDSSQRLVQAERLTAMGRVVGRIAHQLNNPLTTARLIAEALETEALPEPVIAQVRDLGREIERAATTMRELLLFARRGERRLEPVSLEEVIERALSSQRPVHRAAGIETVVELCSDLPRMQADPHGLDQLLSILLDNAAQALGGVAGPRRIVVRAALEPSGSGGAEAVIEVEDNGPGLPEAVLGRIFDPFFTTKPMGAGTGLGLAIAREIAAAHDGVLDAASAPGGGALFRLRLPVVAPLEAVRAPAPPAVENALPRGLRVLVIDDEAQLQEALARVLRLLGCEVEGVCHGEDGVERAKSGEFDVVLCDIFLPGLDGRQVYAHLAETAPHVLDSLAFMTGDSLTDDVREFLASTGRPSLSKPFGRAQLQELLLAVAGAPR